VCFELSAKAVEVAVELRLRRGCDASIVRLVMIFRVQGKELPRWYPFDVSAKHRCESANVFFFIYSFLYVEYTFTSHHVKTAYIAEKELESWQSNPRSELLSIH